MAAHGAQGAVEHVEDAVGRVVAVGRVLPDARVEHLDPVHQRRGEQVVLAREVAVDGAHGDVGAGRHVAHLHRFVAALEPQCHRRVDDALAPGLLRASERAGHRLLHSDSVSARVIWAFETGPLRWPAMPAQQPADDASDRRAGRLRRAVATTDGRVPGERGRQTRQRLLDATVELLTTTSWRSVKVTDIARQARTSPATFYQYFGNVEQAIRVLAEGMVDQAAQLAELVGRRLVRRGELGHRARR